MGEHLDPTALTEALIGRLNGGANWVERRDAATALTLMARLAQLALRRAAGDADPDVAHECKKSVAAIEADLKESPAAVEAELEAALRAWRADRGASSWSTAAADMPAAAVAGGAGPAAGATASELKQWLREIAARQGGELRETEGQWALDFRLGEMRRQTVFIDPGRRDSAGQPVAVMYTLCGPAEPRVFAASLQANAQLSHAAFATVGEGDHRRLVLISRRRMAELTRQNVAETLEYLAKKGDRAESQLQAEDEH